MARSTSGPNSAWKKSVPTISAEGIPASMRPILGYTLWRLHERETYSFVKDASILLTDDKELSASAQKAGVNVKTFDMLLHERPIYKTVEIDLNTYGDVEREFGVLPPSSLASRNGHKKIKQEADSSDAKMEQAGHNQLPTAPQLEEVADLVPTSHGVAKLVDQSSDKVQEEATETQEPQLESLPPPEPQLPNGASEKTTSATKRPETAEVEEPSVGPSKQAAEPAPPKPRAWADVVSNRIRPIEERYPTPALSTQELLEIPMQISDVSIDVPTVQVDQDEEKKSIIADWLRKINATVDGEPSHFSSRPSRKRSPRNKKTEKPSPPQEAPAKPFRPVLLQREPQSSQATSDTAHVVSEKAPTPSPPPSIRPVEETQNPVDALINEKADPAKSTSQHRSTASTTSSVQTVPSKDTSVAKSAPIEEAVDSEEEVVLFIPQAKRLSAQQQTAKVASVEQSAHARQASEGKSVHSKHASVNEPSYNYQASPEKPVPAKRNRHPTSRAPVVIDPDAFGRDLPSNPQTNQQNGFHRPQSRPVPQQGAPRSIAQNGPFRGGARGGRPFINPHTMPSVHNGQNFHPNASMRGGRSHRMPLANSQNGHATINQNSVVVNGQTPHRPSPRQSPRVSPQRIPHANAADPDVDFVLQSGPPRGSTRGKGRLWVPGP